MRKCLIIAIIAATTVVMVADAVEKIESRGQVAVDSFEWNTQNFAGFYYDINDNMGTELLITDITNITGANQLSGNEPYGVLYETQAQSKKIEFKNWGSYYVLGFLGKRYFVGYEKNLDSDQNLFYTESDENTLLDDQIEEILIDYGSQNDNDILLELDLPLDLKQGYKLIIKELDINGNKLIVDLIDRNGNPVEIQPAYITPSKDPDKLAESTLLYTKNVGDLKLVTIAVHFSSIFNGTYEKYGIIDGIWQISDTPVKIQDKYDEMTVIDKDSDDMKIVMSNDGSTINLYKKINLMENFKIRVADNDTLRYYIYKEYTKPGEYEVRGSVAGDSFVWDSHNFAGFYYDIDDNIGTETLTTKVVNRKLKGDEPYGVTYETQSRIKMFKFEDWGLYKVIAFLGNKYLASYEDGYLFEDSRDDSLLGNDRISRILIDDNEELDPIHEGEILKLEENYELVIKQIDLNGQKVHVELRKDRDFIENGVVESSRENATIEDKTYTYKKDFGRIEDMVIIAIHFKNLFSKDDQNHKLATIDGIWQISDEPISVEVGDSYDKMTIMNVNPNKISMCNKDKGITLSKNKTRIIYRSGMDLPLEDDVSLMGDIKIRTADNDSLRYYLFGQKIINTTLTILTGPDNASVYIDQTYMGTTPLEVDIKCGNHIIELKKSGYADKLITKDLSELCEFIYEDLEKLPETSIPQNHTPELENNLTKIPYSGPSTQDDTISILSLLINIFILIVAILALYLAYVTYKWMKRKS